MKNSKLIPTAIIVVFAVWAVIVVARSSGKIDATTLSDTPGCTCHNSQASSNVTVTITGPDTLEVNEEGSYSVSISGGPAQGAGVNIAGSDGELTAVSSTLRKENGELTHQSPVSFSGDAVQFDFNFTAPSETSQITLAAAGNSVNLNGTNSGDEWNHAPDKIVTIASPTSTIDEEIASIGSFVLSQNYPNPFNPETTIRYNLPEAAELQLSVYNMLGQKVATITEGFKSSGQHSVVFDGSDLESGTYIYRLTYDGKSESKRMQLLK